MVTVPDRAAPLAALVGAAPDAPPDGALDAPLLEHAPTAMVAQASLKGLAHSFDFSAGVPGLPGWEAVHTPGHTPGHVAFFRRSDRVLLQGDALVDHERQPWWVGRGQADGLGAALVCLLGHAPGQKSIAALGSSRWWWAEGTVSRWPGPKCRAKCRLSPLGSPQMRG
jgi:glyoxylase-like metal-dependent hydrolase (beta-lactamase superfamily II)